MGFRGIRNPAIRAGKPNACARNGSEWLARLEISLGAQKNPGGAGVFCAQAKRKRIMRPGGTMRFRAP